ncbi:MAG TPA: histidine ammonia-lyase [Thermoanaerobaculia bacterium]|nr:histidine ammonia-lyase [Thermoanaerobaculia bacterium]
MSGTVILTGDHLTLEDVVAVARRGFRAALAPEAVLRVEAARGVIERAVAEDRVVYGVTTGFGKFADVVIPHEKLGELQLNLLRSHAAGVGAPLSEEAVRALVLLRANCLAKGFSGVRPSTLEALGALLNWGSHPFVSSQDSIDASGDLAPLAHLALALVGEGEAFHRGRRLPAAEALRAAGLAPVTLEAKEGLALINGTQMMTAVGALALARLLRLLAAADLVAAMTLDALKGTDAAFDARIHAARPHPGQAASAANLRFLLAGSQIRESHRGCHAVQDAYTLRCAPQVHGAVRDAASHARRVLEIEMNAATDNPMVFAAPEAGRGELVSGGNFHGAPVALVFDYLAAAVADLASISERRTERLVNPALSGDLPAFLVREGGLNSGLMMIHVTAAALVSECKTNAFPASVDSIPTSAGKEDHVSMGPVSARKLARNVEMLETVLAIELLAAAQALHLRGPLRISEVLEEAHRRLRETVPFWEADRAAAPAIEGARAVLADGLHDLVASLS